MLATTNGVCMQNLLKITFPETNKTILCGPGGSGSSRDEDYHSPRDEVVYRILEHGGTQWLNTATAFSYGGQHYPDSEKC